MKLTLDKEKILELYDYYRYALIPITVIVVCILITLFLLLPQLLSTFGNRARYDIEKSKLNVLNDNFTYISSLDQAGLDKNLDDTSLALPQQISFDAVISSIYYAAASSGVGVGDFQFNLEQGTQPGTLSSLTVDLKVFAPADNVLTFVKELYKIYPLSSVHTITVDDKTKELSLVFYYKPFVSVISDNSVAIPKLTTADQATLQEISNWKQPESALAPAAQATASASSSSSGFPF